MAGDGRAPQDRLRELRQREHVVSAIAVAHTDWRRMLEVLEAAATPSEAQDALGREYGFTQVQATAVLDAQFRRVIGAERERITAELEQLRREIDELDGGA